MDAFKRLSNYIEKHRKIPYHQKPDLQSVWYEEGKTAGERIIEITDWKENFSQSDLENPSRSDIRCWLEETFTGIFFGSMEKYCGSMYFNSDIFLITIAGPEGLDDFPELEQSLRTFLNDELFPSLVAGVYDKLKEKQQDIMKEITGS